MIDFQPLNDQVLLRMDVLEASILERGIDDRPMVLPSGRVIAVGRGTFIAGTGFVESQVKPGDHVAVLSDGSWVTLPLSEKKDEVYVTVSESAILGKLSGCEPGTRWWKRPEASRGAVPDFRVR
jgi:co-chaperonin GroES (HSP10)